VAAASMHIFLIWHALGGYLGSICMRLVAQQQEELACIADSCVQNCNALAAIALQSWFFARTQGV